MRHLLPGQPLKTTIPWRGEQSALSTSGKSFLLWAGVERPAWASHQMGCSQLQKTLLQTSQSAEKTEKQACTTVEVSLMRAHRPGGQLQQGQAFS
jgi:hypothetical protein